LRVGPTAQEVSLSNMKKTAKPATRPKIAAANRVLRQSHSCSHLWGRGISKFGDFVSVRFLAGPQCACFRASAGGDAAHGTIFRLSLPAIAPQLTIISAGINAILTWPVNVSAEISWMGTWRNSKLLICKATIQKVSTTFLTLSPCLFQERELGCGKSAAAVEAADSIPISPTPAGVPVPVG